jgi:hypothetical protein
MGNCFQSVGSIFHDVTQDHFFHMMETGCVSEDCQLVLAIDATGSNDRTRFGGAVNYHDISSPKKNIYESVIDIAATLFKQDRDGTIPLFFFGSTEANNDINYPGVLFAGEYQVKGGDPSALLAGYRQNIACQTLDGPTDFRQIFSVVANEVRKTKQYTVLIIISDGGVNVDIEGHLRSLRQISDLPLAITCIGIGNGDFTTMQKFDDAEGRVLDNFQFTNMADVCSVENLYKMREYFFYHAFMEVPIHHKLCREKLHYEPTAQIVHVRRNRSVYLPAIVEQPGEGDTH